MSKYLPPRVPKPLPRRKRPGYLVQCADGRIGVVYKDERSKDSKAIVHIMLAADVRKLKIIDDVPDDLVSDKTARLCDPKKLKVIGMTD